MNFKYLKTNLMVELESAEMIYYIEAYIESAQKDRGKESLLIPRAKEIARRLKTAKLFMVER